MSDRIRELAGYVIASHRECVDGPCIELDLAQETIALLDRLERTCPYCKIAIGEYPCQGCGFQ